MGVWAARIWLRVSSVGIPRSITQVRWAFPYCFSILYQKVGQGGLVRGIPRHDLIGQWKTVRSHDQGDHHLHAIWTFVAAVTKREFDVRFGAVKSKTYKTTKSWPKLVSN